MNEPPTIIPVVSTIGERGKTGDPGRPGPGAFRQFAILAVFVLLTAITLAYLVQQGRAYTVDQCELRREAVIHNNRTWQQLTAIEEMPVPAISPQSAERIRLRIQIYADAQVPVPECDQ